jgi:hypothetical protein
MTYRGGGLLLLLILLLHTQVGAQDPNITCDKRLQPITSDLSYKWRSNRCEGLYRSKVDASVRIVSYLRGELSFARESDTHLLISAPSLSYITSKRIHIRAVAIPLKTYYQMDAMLPIDKPFKWPIDTIVRKAGINRYNRP